MTTVEFSVEVEAPPEQVWAVASDPRNLPHWDRHVVNVALPEGGMRLGARYSVVMGFMGMLHSWWAVLALPATLLIGFAFSAVCMGLTTYMKSWQDFDKITLIQLPLFLFSATFFPITVFDEWLRWIVEATPLYRGVVLCRELTTGVVTWDSAVSVVYLVALGLFGMVVVRRRLEKLLLT